MEDKCSVGELTLTDCHQFSYETQKAIENVNDLSEDEQILLKLRTESEQELHTICLHHKSIFLKKFEFLQKLCCDPIKRHKKPIKKALRAINVQQSEIIMSKGYKIKPGQKLCSSCRNLLLKSEESKSASNDKKECLSQDDSDEKEALSLGSDDIGLPSEEFSELEKKETLNMLNVSFTEAGSSPLKLHALSEHSKKHYGKRKLEQLQENVKQKIEKVLEVELPIEESESQETMQQKVADMDKLTEIMKKQLQLTSKKKKIQILTIPASLMWTRKKMKETFNVSDYSIRQAQKLAKEKGFLAEPSPKCGKILNPETAMLVKKFYESDDHSRVLPGMKDIVSLGRKQYERKRLILSNLKELYCNFKSAYPDIKVGFSKFCSLRPKWCVLAGASGTHSVCVCTIHQNVILLIHAAQIKEQYKDLIKLLLCEEPKRECKLRHCNECPSNQNLIRFLEEKFGDYDENDTIEYKQWISTDRTELISCSSQLYAFIEDLTTKLEKLIPHSFIAKSQSAYFKSLKESSSTDIAAVLLDFSENYSFTIQDEAQGYHWTSASCTVHPVMIHCRNADGEKVVSSHCVISDDLKHDVSMVYGVQKTIVEFIKKNYSQIKEFHYFSDGCAGQYKNKFNFMNLCLHEKDFNIKGQWSFFATSHGKTECDGIGGTVKRLARKESLQRPLEKQITTPIDFFHFCKDNIAKINFYFISKDSVDLIRSNLENRFKDVVTIPGTRSFHNFKPLDSTGTVEVRRISSDEKSSLTYKLKDKCTTYVTVNDLYISCYVACIYDNFWYFGIVTDINEEEDATIKFMHPQGPSPSFYWPKREDICPVPIPHLLAVIDPPATSTGRVYQFPIDCMKMIQERMNYIKELK